MGVATGSKNVFRVGSGDWPTLGYRLYVIRDRSFKGGGGFLLDF